MTSRSHTITTDCINGRYPASNVAIARYGLPNLAITVFTILLLMVATSGNSRAQSNIIDNVDYGHRTGEKDSSRSIVFNFRPSEKFIVLRNKPPRFFQYKDNHSLATQAVITHDQDLQFHRLWIQQHQDNYRSSSGGAAVGQILRMGIKSWYKSYVDSHTSTQPANADNTGLFFTELNYRLRFSSKRVKLGIDYEF